MAEKYLQALGNINHRGRKCGWRAPLWDAEVTEE